MNPLFDSTHPTRTPLNNEALAARAIVEEEAGQQVSVTPDHLGLWTYVAAVLRDKAELKFPHKIPDRWKAHPPEVWLIAPPNTTKEVMRGMIALFKSIGATVHEGAQSRFDRRDPI